ncbi:3-phenylpropionate/trans-cinnamate dioxygenase ferredoxin reductase subunit [Pseudorhizobium tarimense]|uniref:3-phenylpropionate/trans-cinnamate dioxygenase ferredoxin reductase subunit n=1 Tax=Pseudorhizobium tarimense TaxID=1079109 RepID=A0ABV2HDG4_9HYPH|nr:FAD-dependent oxidoreductase [Pseudorhizobium tarimense]MCJ8521537.1 FAD-dependent oxidoreductase [Pseudorhizobium tarimense]
MAGVVIVGAGECGVSAAFALRERGYTGSVTLISEEPHLPYERPPLSKASKPTQKLIRSQVEYKRAAIELCLGVRIEALDLSRHILVACDGSSWTYERLLLATGARARLFPGTEGAATLRTFDDACCIFQRLYPGTKLVIIGGGFIGLELAAAARAMDVRVTVIEAAPRLMARAVPAEIAAVVEQRHRAGGVDLRLGTQVTSMMAGGVSTADGSTVQADIVVAGTGAAPNTDLAERAGLALDNGIRVDNRFRTSASDVFAAGDCCSIPHQGGRLRLESWRMAQEQGIHAAASMMGEVDDFSTVPWFWSDQYDLGLQVAGVVASHGITTMRRLSEDAILAFQRDVVGRLICAAGVGPGNRVAKDIRLAEMLIARGTHLSSDQLSDPEVNLKSLLKAA